MTMMMMMMMMVMMIKDIKEEMKYGTVGMNTTNNMRKGHRPRAQILTETIERDDFDTIPAHKQAKPISTRDIHGHAHPSIHSFAHSYHSYTHSDTHPPTQSMTHLLSHPLTHPYTHPSPHSLTHPPPHSLTHSLTWNMGTTGSTTSVAEIPRASTPAQARVCR